MEKKRILVVDDEANVVRSLSFVLTKNGYEVSSARDGEEALRKVREFRPQLIFLDIMMPRKNGFEVCQEIKKMPDTRDIPIVMLSAKGVADQDPVLNCGAYAYISKPFSPQEIVTRVNQILS